MSYAATKDRLRKARERFDTAILSPVSPVVSPVSMATGDTVLQVVAVQSVTDVTDVTYEGISHDDCDKKNIIKGDSGSATDPYNNIFSVQSLAYPEKTGDIGDKAKIQVVEVSPMTGDNGDTTGDTTGDKSVTEPLRRAADLGLNAKKDEPSKFVDLVVSDNDMLRLYYRAHKAGDAMTSTPLLNAQPCEHLVTGFYPGGYR